MLPGTTGYTSMMPSTIGYGTLMPDTMGYCTTSYNSSGYNSSGYNSSTGTGGGECKQYYEDCLADDECCSGYCDSYYGVCY